MSSLKPHWLQNLAPAGFWWPQLGQDAGNSAPHSLQNLLPSAFAVWHFGQIILGSFCVRLHGLERQRFDQ